jgi:hypothetical protein
MLITGFVQNPEEIIPSPLHEHSFDPHAPWRPSGPPPMLLRTCCSSSSRFAKHRGPLRRCAMSCRPTPRAPFFTMRWPLRNPGGENSQELDCARRDKEAITLVERRNQARVPSERSGGDDGDRVLPPRRRCLSLGLALHKLWTGVWRTFPCPDFVSYLPDTLVIVLWYSYDNVVTTESILGCHDYYMQT